MMEAHEFGISPHKRGESIQRIHSDVTDEESSSSYDPPSRSSSAASRKTDDEGTDRNNSHHTISNDSTAENGIMSPLLWRAENQSAGQNDIVNMCAQVEKV
jgi:hypothetical protein